MLVNPVETDRAIYELIYSHHKLANHLTVEGADAVVCETGQSSGRTLWIDDLLEAPQYKHTLSECMNLGIPVYSVDVASPPSWSEMGKQSVLSKGIIAVARYLLGSFLNIKQYKKILEAGKSIPYDPQTAQQLLEMGYGHVTWRDALWAHKLEQVIAPHLQEDANHKPHIVVSCGAGHMGLHDSLEDVSRRHRLLEEMLQKGMEDLSLYELLTVSIAHYDQEKRSWIYNEIPVTMPEELVPEDIRASISEWTDSSYSKEKRMRDAMRKLGVNGEISID